MSLGPSGHTVQVCETHTHTGCHKEHDILQHIKQKP